ncbi:glycosyltransferase family 1 protein [Chengkuizengella sediminis]|uniref:glycosyltransferase family 1 protein n=1 Tax=Chengkuizengella sediminis TaxID=1885917 RepID=UPI00138970DB|nr:glycosyltransferase family 1 protein [Chengkuizengella sediminis]
MRILMTSKPILEHILVLYNIGQTLAKQGVEIFVLNVPGFKDIPIMEHWNFIESKCKEMSFEDNASFQSLAHEIKNEFQQEEQHLIEMLSVIEHHHIDVVLLDSSLSGASYACEIKQIPWFSVEPASFTLEAKQENEPEENETIILFMQRYLNQLRKKYQLTPLPRSYRSNISYVGVSPYLHMIPANNINQVNTPSHFFFIGPQLYKNSKQYFKKTKFHHHVLIETLTYDNPQFLIQTVHFIEECIRSLHDKENLIIRCTSSMMQKIKVKQKNVLFVDCKKHQVMPYLNCKLVLNQGSYGSFFNSIKNKIPQISVPQGWDSRYFTNFVDRDGLGEIVEPSECSQIKILEQYNKIMSNFSSYRDNIKHFNDKCKKIDPTFKIMNIFRSIK